MMSELRERGEALARKAQQRNVRSLAQQLRSVLGSASVEVEEARVLVRGRGILRRWLLDPGLRFLAGELK